MNVNKTTSKALKLLYAMGLGAGVMYMLDPNRGKRRRALARDQLLSLARQGQNSVADYTQDLSHRTKGLLAQARANVPTEDVADPVLENRVRAELGRLLSSLGPIAVTAHQGHVILRGPIHPDALDIVLTQVATVPGVTSVEDQLDPQPIPTAPHLRPDAGGLNRQMDILVKQWLNAGRFALGTIGAAMVLQGLLRGGLAGTARKALGLALIAVALNRITNNQPEAEPLETPSWEPETIPYQEPAEPEANLGHTNGHKSATESAGPGYGL